MRLLNFRLKRSKNYSQKNHFVRTVRTNTLWHFRKTFVQLITASSHTTSNSSFHTNYYFTSCVTSRTDGVHDRQYRNLVTRIFVNEQYFSFVSVRKTANDFGLAFSYHFLIFFFLQRSLLNAFRRSVRFFDCSTQKFRRFFS